MRILLAGGGSGGSATPILAVASELRVRVPDVELLYIGTHGGPEAELAAEERIPYVGVATGKLRRYWDTQNVSDVGRVASRRRRSRSVTFGDSSLTSPAAPAGSPVSRRWRRPD